MSRYKFSWVLLILFLTGFVVLLPSLSILATADTIELYPAADTFIVDNQPDTNFGSSTGLMVGQLSNTGLLHARIRFSGIPAGASIQSATLRLYRTMGSGSHTLAVQSVSRSWHESILTWDTDGSTNRWTTPKSTYAMSNQTGYVSVDVTSHVQEWANGSRSNYGFHLSTDGTTGENHTFASRESATSSYYRPKLEVTYSASPPNPDLRSVSGIPSSVNVGEPFTVTVTAENDGGASPEGAINASVRYTDGTHDLAMDGPDASWADGHYNRDPEYYPIYNKYCQPMTAADHMVEAVDSDWQNAESHSMSFTVTPEKAGTLYVRVRTTMRNGPVENCDYRNDTSASGGTSATDQQGWTCRQYSVTVVADSASPPNPDLRSVSGIPSSVNVGEPFTVTVTAENDGGASPEGAINASVRYTDGTHDLAMDGPDASWADGHYNRDPEYYPIYNKYCQPMTAADHMVEAVDSDWQNAESHSMSFTVTPEKAGTLYVRVRTTMRNGPVENCDYRNDTSASGGTSATDQQGWTCRQYSVTVVADSAEIVEFNPPTGTLQRGTETEARVRVRNTGSTRRSFWVGLSFAHSTATGDGWPVGWYDIQPIQTGILDPGDEEEVTLPVAIAETFRAGQYYAVSCVWDAFNEELYIMEGRIDSTLWHPMEHPEWVDNPDLGMLSFSLPQFNVPHAARTIMDEFETISWILENKGLQELYLEGKKPLLCLKVSVPIQIAGMRVDVGGAILIDLADLCELTPEGKKWTTIWIDSEVGGIAFGVNLDKPGNEVEFKPIDAAIIMHNFDYNERGIADFRDRVLEWFTGTTPEIGFGSVTVPGMCFTAAKYYDRDNIEGPSYDRCGTTKLGITVMNAINVLHKVEMRTQYVRMALLAWSLGQDLQENIVPIGEYVSHVNAILDSYPNSADVFRDFTYDDGDWPLQQGQPQTNLKMRLVNNDFYNSLHRFYIDVSEGASDLTFQSSDGTGDCRIYYSLNRRPNLATGDWDGRSPDNPNSTLQTCSIENPVVAGRYYVALHVSTSEPYEYEGVRFVATYETVIPYDVCMSIPTDCQSFTYSSATSPVLSADPSQAKPMGLGPVAEGGGTLSITVQTCQFSGPVDIYFGLYSPEIDPDNIYLLTSGGAFQKLSEGLAPWKANITGPINESLFGDIQTSSLPKGTYYLYLLVTPTGNLSNYYLWITSFGS